MRSSSTRRVGFLRAFLAAAAALFSGAPVAAETFTWTSGSAGNGNWSNPVNWINGSVPTSGNTADILFASSPRTTLAQDLANPLTIRSLFFYDNPYTLGGNGLAFDAESGGIFNYTTTSISNSITFNATTRYEGTGNITFTNTISGPGGFIKNGTGTVTFNTFNLYGGNTDINAGQITLGHTQGLLFTTVNLNVNNGLNVNGQQAVIGNLAGTGSLNLGSASISVGTNNTSQTYSGQITGTGAIDKRGSGTWTLTAAGSSFGRFSASNGRTLLSGGSLTLTTTGGINRALTLGSVTTGNLDVFAGAVLNTYAGGAGSAQINGPAAAVSTLTVAGASSRWDAWQIDIGTGANAPGAVVADNGGVINATDIFVGKPAGGTLVVQNGGIVNATHLNASSAAADPVPTVALRSNGQAVVTETILSTPTSSIDVDRGTLHTAMLTSASGNGSITLRDPFGSSALVIDGSSASATYTGSISGSGGITKNGASTQTLSGPNTYSGATTVNGGNLILTNGSSAAYNANGTGTITLNFGDLGHSSLRVSGGGTINYPATVIGGFIRGSDGTHNLKAVTSFNGTTFAVDSALTQDSPLTLNNVTNSGNFTNKDSLTWDGGVNTSAGTLTVNAKAMVTALENNGVIAIQRRGVLTNSNTNLASGGGGRIVIDPEGQLELVSSELNLNGSLLVNNGSVKGTVNVHFNGLATGGGEFGKVNLFENGRFAPGASANPAVFSPAAVAAEQVGFAPATALAVQIGGRAPGTGFDQVNVAGAAALAGTLEISTTEFTPAALDAFAILTFKSRAGGFSTFTGTDAGNGLVYAPVYGDGDLTLVATIPGDATLDGRVSFADLLALARHYNATGAAATWVSGDFTYDQRVSFADLLVLARHYNQSAFPVAGQFSPAFEADWASALQAAVPEPGSAAVLVAALAVAGRRRRRAS